jgi:class 3 adenylate cyclase/tetratricopeptide (TPR) repeat protein
MDIGAWLRRLGLEQYERSFIENDIDLATLQALTADDLKELGVLSVGHRRKLLNAIQELEHDEPSASGPATNPFEAMAAGGKPQAAFPRVERRNLTVLFCDLVGSASLSTSLDPEELRDLLRQYQQVVATHVHRFEGHVAQYVGDGVVAYFGFPRAHEDDAERAVRAALGIRDAAANVPAPDGGSIAVRIGIATGLVVAGDVLDGDATKEDAVVGDTPNLAARLQALAQPNEIVIAESTRRLVGETFELVQLATAQLKGFADPVCPWRVGGHRSIESRFEAHLGGVTPIIGREQEVHLLLARWQQAAEGEGQVLLLSGEPGIGKSRITRALLDEIAPFPHTRLRYQCSPYYAGSAFYPIIEQMERAAGFTRDDSSLAKLEKLEAVLAKGTKDVATAAPLLAAMLSSPFEGRYPPLTVTPQRQKELTNRALVDQVLGLASTQPVLIVFEDAHWADGTTLEVLGQIIDRIEFAPVMLLATFRPEFVPPWRSRSSITTIALSRLGRRQSGTIVSSVTGGKGLPPEVLEQIIAKTDGIPLFVEELTKTVLETGLLRDDGDCYLLARPLTPLTIPATLQDSLMARLDRLAPVKEVAQLGSAIGRDFSYRLVAAVSSLREPELRDALAQLAASELIFVRGEPPEATYTFKHALVQDTAYASLLKIRRQQIHARIAEALEQLSPEAKDAQPELLAQHFTLAGLIERAIPLWIQAGQKAQERAALDDAVRHLAQAVELTTKLREGGTRDLLELQARVALAAAFSGLEGPPSLKVREALEPAINLIERISCLSSEDWLRVMWGLALHHVTRSEYPRTLELAAEMISYDPRPGASTEFLGRSMTSFVGHCKGQHKQAVMEMEEVMRMYDPREHDTLVALLNFHPKMLTQVFRSHSLCMMGFPDQAVEVARRTLQEAEELGHIFNLAWGRIMFSPVYMFRREPERQIALIEQGRELASAHGIGFLSDFLIWWAADSYFQLGDYERARSLAKMGSQYYPAMGGQHTVPYMKAIYARASARLGRIDDALASLEEALAGSSRTEEREHEPEIRRILGEVHLGAGQSREAERNFIGALELARSQEARGWELRTALSLAELWGSEGRSSEARNLLAPLVEWFVEGQDTADVRDARSMLQRLD